MQTPADRAKLMGGAYDAQYGGESGYGRPGGYAAPTEQHLLAGGARGPGGRDHIADAQVGFEQLKQGRVPDFKFKILFFSCAAVVMAAAVLADLQLITTFEIADFNCIREVYVTIFGLVMLVLDFPRSDARADSLRRMMTKYFRFLTLFTGRGCAYIFLATLTYAALHDVEQDYFLGYLMGGYVFLVGVGCVYVGVKESLKLTGLRARLMKEQPGFLNQYMTHSGGQTGMTTGQFAEMTRALGTSFDEETVGFVFDNLRGSLAEGSQFLAEDDLQRWIAPTGEGEKIPYTVF